MEAILVVVGVVFVLLGAYAFIGLWGGLGALLVGLPKLFKKQTRQEGKEAIFGGLIMIGLSLLYYVGLYTAFTYLF